MATGPMDGVVGGREWFPGRARRWSEAMRVIPKRFVEMLWFFANRVDGWGEDPAAIGLESATVDAVRQAVLDMEAAREEAGRARLLAEAATERYHARAGELRVLGSGAVGTIKAYALASGDASVYPRAGIPRPATGGKGAAPGMATRFAVGLLGDGSLELSWECDNGRARGVLYEVERSVDGGPYAAAGIVGEKRFVDRHLPGGTGMAIYRVTAARVAGGAGGGGSALVRGKPACHIVSIGKQTEHRVRAAA